MKYRSILSLSLVAFLAGTTAVSAAEQKAPAPAQKVITAAEKRAAARKAQAEAAASRNRIAELRKLTGSLMYSKKQPYTECIRLMKEKLNDPAIAADPMCRLFLYEQIITYAKTPPWTQLARYDWNNIHAELPAAAKAIQDDKEIKNPLKLKAYRALVEYYSGEQKWDEAEKTARQAMTLIGLDEEKQAAAVTILADVYRFSEKYDLFCKTVEEAKKIHPVTAANYGAAVMMQHGKKDEAAALWKSVNAPYEELLFYTDYIPATTHFGRHGFFGHGIRGLTDDRSKQALAFVLDTNNDTAKRFEVAARYFFQINTPDAKKARKSLIGTPAKQVSQFGIFFQLIYAYSRGDYELVTELAELYAPLKSFWSMPARKKIRIISYGAAGKIDEAVKFADEAIADEKTTPLDRARYQFYKAILKGESTDGILAAAKLPRKDEAAVLLSAARNCQIWKKYDLVEKYSADYLKYFAEQKKPVMPVVYFDQPVSNITAWRNVWSKLDKQHFNIKYRGSLEFLETDVATGDRNVNIDKNAKEQDRFMELTALCDIHGLHLFLRMEADNARQIEQGLAPAVSPEIYFAPGENQPYTCIGAEARTGLGFMFHTTYNNKGHQRIDPKNAYTSFKIESEFTDKDYVIHLFFAWDDYANKLPANGTDWRFDAIIWGPAGGYSWGGSQGVHAASAWGNLRFQLTDKQLNQIRRALIFKTYKSWKNVQRDPSTRANIFLCWSDSGVGDPEFYAKILKPLEAELDAYAAKVKPDMTDADVAEIYTKAYPRWKGIVHEIDELRRKYLTEQLTAE